MSYPAIMLRLGMHLGAAITLAWHASVMAALPPPSEAEAQAAAAKKAQTDAQAEKDKESLAASMDAVATRWRKRAEENGWDVHAQTPVKAAQGINASATQSSSSGQPDGKLGDAAKQAPVRSEKSGTAPPSPDVKQDVKPETRPDVKAKAPAKVD